MYNDVCIVICSPGSDTLATGDWFEIKNSLPLESKSTISSEYNKSQWLILTLQPSLCPSKKENEYWTGEKSCFTGLMWSYSDT